ncbi:MAG TPA: sodium:proton antiporter NhaD [Fibrobacteraceae bacterium]|nr:sodium:proton antiporter NhaD [Fibrobacteraceae bacterium]
MTLAMTVVFVLAYLAIALEHPIHLHKSASALFGAAICWSIYALMSGDPHAVHHDLLENLAESAGIVVFLMGAMTIVEIIDGHGGFTIVTNRITTRNLRTLLWTITWITFFLSAILDNLTTTIVMVSLIRKLLAKRQDRLFFAGMVVIAANAGGAWSPIGDVTTTMLWIGGQISAAAIVKGIFLPSILNLLVPLFVISLFLKGEVESPTSLRAEGGHTPAEVDSRERKLIFFMGVGALLFVPVFKTVTHLPPWMGVLFGLSVLWITTEILHRGKESTRAEQLGVVQALRRIDLSSVLFFLGILLAVGSLSAVGQLTHLAEWLEHAVGNTTAIVMLTGALSAIVDNVPLVAAGMGMYPMDLFPQDHFLWEFLAYCAGTGGSMLVIGSAAGVAAMGIEKITFGWYLQRIAPLALLGYLAGAGTYVLQYALLH